MADFDKKVSLIEVQIDQKAALKQVDELTIAIAKQKKTVKENTHEIKGLEKANSDLQKEVKKGTVTQADANKTIEANEKDIKKLTLTTAKERDGLKTLNAERRQAVKESKVQSNSLDALRIQSVKLKKQLNAQETATKEGRKAFSKLSKELKGTNEKIRTLDQGAGDFKTSVGKYPGIIGKAVDGFSDFSTSLVSFGGNLKSGQTGLSTFASTSSIMPSLLGGASKAMGGLTTASMAFIATGVGAIVAILGIVFLALKSALERNEETMLKFQKAMAPLTAGMDLLLAALQPIAEFIIDELIASFEQLTSVFTVFSKAVQKGLKALGFDKAAESLENFSKKHKELTDLTVTILELENSFRLLRRSLIGTTATLEGQLALYEQISGDATLSFQAQQKAAEKALQTQEKLLKKRKEEAVAEENIIKNKIKAAELNDRSTSDLLDQLAQVQATKKGYDNEYTVFKEKNAQLQRQIEQDLWEQQLDFSIDVGTKRTEEALKASENEKLSLEERKAAIEEARRLDQEAFENQISLFEEVGLSRTQINDLINESNAQVISSELEKTELSEKERDRFRELVIERENNNKAIKESDQALLDFQAEQQQEAIEAADKLNKELDKRKIASSELDFKIRLQTAANAQEAMDIMYDQENADFERKMERLKEEEEALAENKEITEEERAVVEEELRLAKEEALLAHKDRMVGIEENANQQILDNLDAAEAGRQKIINKARQKTEAIVNLANSIVEGRYAKRFKDLEKQFASGQITEEEYEKKKAELQKKSALEAWKVQTAAFRSEQALNTASVISNTVSAISKLVARNPPLGLPQSAVVAAMGAVRVGTILASPAPPRPSFAQGGDVFGTIAGGRPHSQGGTKYRGEDGNVFEVEKGEGLFVTKREATNPALALLDQANTSFGGTSMFSNGSRFLQDGGSVAMESTGFSQEDLIAAIEATPPPMVQVQSIMAGINAEMEAKKVGTI